MRQVNYLQVAALVTGFVLAAGLQWKSGAFHADWSSDADEPAHYVTGLMVRDWAANGFPWPPMRFAGQFYDRYPKVGLGHWPPLFYVVQGVWTLAFTPSRVSVLLLMATLAAWLAADVFELLRTEVSLGAGIAGALVLLTLPAVQESSRSVHTEILTAVLILRAAVAYGRYLDTLEWRSALRFGLWASLAILSKASGVVLVAVPLLGILLTRRYRLLATPAFWLPALIVLTLCGPWYAWAPGARHEAVAPYGRPRFAHWRVARLGADWNGIAPFWLWPFAAAGAIARVFKPEQPEKRGLWAALIGLAAGATAGRLVILAWEARHLIYAAPAVVALAAAGAARLASGLQRWLLAPAVAALCLMNVYRMPPKTGRGYVEVVRSLLPAAPSSSGSPILICADAIGEGALIAEVAMRDSLAGSYPTGHSVERASKLLARSSWQGDRYQLLAASPEDAMRRIEESRTRLLILDESGDVPEHVRLVAQALEKVPRWQMTGAHNGPIRIYRLAETPQAVLSKDR